MQHLRIAWHGQRIDGMEWLFDRMGCYHSSRITSVEVRHTLNVAIEAIEGSCQRGVDRLVFSCSSRIDYPKKEIDWVQRSYPEIPFALVMGSYWDGARRTGIGAALHVAMPWHRWWDGWADWLDARSQAMLEPCTEPMAYDAKSRLMTRPSVGVIVANCGQTATAWRWAAEQVHASVRVQTGSQLEHGEPVVELGVDWVLWDDSCLATVGDVEAAEESLIRVVRRFPQARIICAFSMPRWHQCSNLRDLGVREWLSKPNTGRGLQRAIESLTVI